MGHTTTGGDVRTRFNGRTIFIDVGMSEAYGGHLGALIIEGGKLYTINGDGKLKLLSEPDGAALPHSILLLDTYLSMSVQPTTPSTTTLASKICCGG